jgi:copper transport protein
VRRLALAIAALALLVPAAASAHATLKQEQPAFGQELQRAPKTVRLHFDQYVKFPAIEVLDNSGRNYAGKATLRGLTVLAAVRPLATGAYTVRWHALSADGHVVSGVWTFGLRVPAPPPTEAYGAGGPTHIEHVVRWLYFVALALVIGSLGLRLICLHGVPLPPPVEKRLYLVSLSGVVGVIELGIVGFCLRSEDVLQLPFGKFLYGDLSPISGGTRFGKAFIAMTLGFALVAAFVYLAWLTGRVVLLVPALGLALAFVAGLSVSGHDGVDPGSSWNSELADWVHLSAATLWIGALVSLVVVWAVAGELRRTMFVSFSRLATWLVALVLAAGTYLAIVRLPHFRDLWTQGYGQVLLVKIALVGLVLAWGAIHHFVVRPSVGQAGDGFLARVGRSVAGESLVAIAVLLAAAILVDSKPPPRPAPAPVTQAARR